MVRRASQVHTQYRIAEEALAVLKPGEYFGEIALIDNFPRSATVVTNDDADVFSVRKPDQDRVLVADRDLGYKMLWTFTKALSRRLRETDDKLEGFLALSSGLLTTCLLLFRPCPWYSNNE